MHVRDLCGLSLWGLATYSHINFSIKSHVQLQTFASSTTVESINHCFFSFFGIESPICQEYLVNNTKPQLTMASLWQPGFV